MKTDIFYNSRKKGPRTADPLMARPEMTIDEIRARRDRKVGLARTRNIRSR